jgi:hypothetical protein
MTYAALLALLALWTGPADRAQADGQANMAGYSGIMALTKQPLSDQSAGGGAGGQTLSPLATRAAELAGNFASPPPSAKTGVFWFWINGNITREGITADLEAMARVGIGKVLLFETSGEIPEGPVKFLGDGWRALFRHALDEAARLGVTLNINNGLERPCHRWHQVLFRHRCLSKDVRR